MRLELQDFQWNGSSICVFFNFIGQIGCREGADGDNFDDRFEESRKVFQRIMIIARTVNSEARKDSKERERKLLRDFHKENGKRKKFDIKISSRVAYVSSKLLDDFSRNFPAVMQEWGKEGRRFISTNFHKTTRVSGRIARPEEAVS